ncbi:MAG: UDP-N-acetylmuramate dehydrogenase [Coriobacteriales bacterium]|jgi:UDP-N-acetylmuramate dehydrogenase|nr:UDP-N-acetylmuramate dehydrogenase [Coriobacteriales bacterium]
MLSDEAMSRHTSYRIGGPADYFYRAADLEELRAILQELAQAGLPYFVCGKGSNLLVSDAGYRGAIITLGKGFKTVEVVAEVGPKVRVKVGAGLLLAELCQRCYKLSLSGMEFAVGIPGTIGGALAMNAGTKDGAIGDRVHQLWTLDRLGITRSYTAQQMAFGYRESSLAPGEVVVAAELELAHGIAATIRERMNQSFAARQASQPLGKASCGSVFKNPPGDSAGRLIEACGLKGYRIGGAEVSQKHANFIINQGNASASEVLALIVYIQDQVETKYGQKLQPEVKFLGFN